MNFSCEINGSHKGDHLSVLKGFKDLSSHGPAKTCSRSWVPTSAPSGISSRRVSSSPVHPHSRDPSPGWMSYGPGNIPSSSAPPYAMLGALPSPSPQLLSPPKADAATDRSPTHPSKMVFVAVLFFSCFWLPLWAP